MRVISGSGAPSINTVANPGDIYIDIDTDNAYICREIISQSTNYISDVRTEYYWKRYLHFSRVAITGNYNDLIDRPNPIKTINGISPDSNGNVEIEIPAPVTDEHINSLIDNKLGVIENGSY